MGMGVVDVRNERLPEVGEIELLGAAGAEIVSPDRIALNPDCGFAPDFGQPPSIDEAFLTHLRHEDIVNDFFRCFPAPKCLLVNIGVGESGCSVNLPS